MENVIKGTARWLFPAAEKRNEGDEIVTQLREVQRSLENVRSTYDLLSDPDLIEASIYEEMALMARFRHLHRKARERGVCQEPFA